MAPKLWDQLRYIAHYIIYIKDKISVATLVGGSIQEDDMRMYCARIEKPLS